LDKVSSSDPASEIGRQEYVQFYQDLADTARGINTGIAELDNWAKGYADQLGTTITGINSGDQATFKQIELDGPLVSFILDMRSQIYKSVGLDAGTSNGFQDVLDRANDLKTYLEEKSK
jgi:hypothetical protein